MVCVFCSVAAVLRAVVVGRCGGSDGGGIDGAHVFAYFGGVGVVVVIAVFGLAGFRVFGRGGGGGCAEFVGGGDGDFARVDVFEVVEFALADLLADDVDVAGEVDLLD